MFLISRGLYFEELQYSAPLLAYWRNCQPKTVGPLPCLWHNDCHLKPSLRLSSGNLYPLQCQFSCVGWVGVHKDHFSVHIFSGAVVLEDLPYSRVLTVSRNDAWFPGCCTCQSSQFLASSRSQNFFCEFKQQRWCTSCGSDRCISGPGWCLAPGFGRLSWCLGGPLGSPLLKKVISVYTCSILFFFLCQNDQESRWLVTCDWVCYP